MKGFAEWARVQRRVYLGNATSVRDFRAQLRGNRPILLWSIYLGLLVLFVVLAYSNIVAQGQQSVTVVQTQLKSFYKSILWMLEVMVALVAPVIVAMSIQSEVQRKSYDLIATSPVTPKYYLIGKVLSGYRYVLMLIFLSLPVTAAAVVLGGATYGEVFISYFMIAMHGLLYIAISLPIAVISTKVVPAVIYSYTACWGYALFASAGAAMYMSRSMWMGGPQEEAPFYALLTPAMIETPVDAHTSLGKLSVPNWILATAVILVIVRFMVVGAGSAMTRKGSKETASLRIHGLVITAVITGIAALSQFSIMGTFTTMGASSSGGGAQELCIFFTVLSLPLIFALPNLSTWSYVDEHKHRPGGIFDVRQLLSGAPEGGLPYLLALLATMFAVGSGVLVYFGGAIDAVSIVYFVWLTGCWVFVWAIGWLVSSFTRTGAGTAKKSHIASTVIIGLLPWPFLSIVTAMSEADWLDVFRIYPFAGFLYNLSDLDTVVLMVFELWVAAAALTIWAEFRRRSVVSLYKRALNARQ
ncbi:MAG: hypothetical protein WD716_07135 [Fimbriimonadaceae bacterium]